jgi:hypothetical protein
LAYGLALEVLAVSFAKKGARGIGRPIFRLPRAPSALLVRSFFLGLAAIGGAAWGLVRHYTHEPPPLVVPFHPRPSATYDADAGEIPVPDFLEED